MFVSWFIARAVFTLLLFPDVRLWHRLTWNDIRNLQVQPRNLKWGQHGQYVYYRDFSNNVIEVDMINHNQKAIFTFEQWNKVGYDDFDVTGHNRLLILAKNNGTSLLHLNFVNLYKYKIGDINNQPQMFERNVAHWSIVSHATEDRLVFVAQDQPSNCYNIRLHELGPQSRTLKVIGDLNKDKPALMNGVLSYLYSEEFYTRSSQGFWVSQNGDYIVYMITDTSTMSPISVQSPSDPDKKISYYYPTVKSNKNPVVRLRMYDVLQGEIITGADDALNPLGKQDREYITSVSFPNAKKLLVEFMNREQTRATTEECTLNLSPTCENLRVLRRNSFLGWLPRYSAVAFPAKPDLSTQQYYVLRPRVDKQFNFTHLHKYETTNDPNRKIAITTGEYAVTELIGNDHTRQHVYYISTEKGPHTRHLYRITPSTGKKHCLSCEVGCSWVNEFSTSLSPDLKHLQMTCLGPAAPNRVYLFRTSQTRHFRIIRTVPDAELVIQRSVTTEILRVRLSGRWFYVKIYKPSNFNPARRYPVVFDVYGGPTMNKVSTRYKVGYDHYLAGRYGTIVVNMDVRGTPGRSDNFWYAIYKNLGTIEVADSIKVIKWVRRLPYIDSRRMGIMGASYGGYLVLKILEAEPRLFRAAVSSAAVSDWQWYDTAYTERYLGLYNKEIYKKASVLPNLRRIPNGVLLLLHGLSDTNVLMRHHWAVVRRLNRRHKIYSHYVKPGQTHRLRRLFHTLLWFRDKLWRRGRRCWIG